MTQARNARLVLLALTSLTGAASCAGNEQMMAASAEIPAAEGKVSTEDADNGNTRVRIEVKHLAPPRRVAPDATTYVVWLEAAGSTTQNVGALRVDDDLVGSLEFVTVYKTFRVVVTPEALATLSAPSHRAVFTADVNAR
jgi:hypothetical protein